MIIRKSPSEIERMARSGALVARTLAAVGAAITPGVTTAELDALAEEFIRSQGAEPTFKGYRGYPASICASPNSMVVHGIPGGYTLAEGDVLSVDVGVTLNGFVGDGAFTFPVGEIDPAARELLETCRAALTAGVERARAGSRLSDISHAVQQTTEAAGFSIIRTLVGHGVGRAMHEDPQIPNFGKKGRGIELKSGMILAIEPMVNEGKYKVQVLPDGWTVVTEDGSLSAHFEHSVAITDNGPDILSKLN
jgi:methionine aminopeptidase, type I